MLLEAGLRNTFWAVAVNTANYIQNRVITKSTNQIPFYIWNGKKPDTSHFRIFGSKCFIYVPKEKRRKLDNTAESMIFMGYDENSKANRCYDSIAKKLVISRNVRFVSSELHGSTFVKKIRQPVEIMDDDNNWNDGLKVRQILMVRLHQIWNHRGGIQLFNMIQMTIKVNFHLVMNISRMQIHHSVRSRLQIRNQTNMICSIVEPKTLSEALVSPDKDKWLQAINDEIHSLKKNQTWFLCELLADRKAIGYKWVFKIKTDERGNILRYKARFGCTGVFAKVWYRL